MNVLPSYTVSAHADITVESPRRRILLVVECQLARNVEEATETRRTLLGEGYLNVPDDAFFMLAFSTEFYLWKPQCAIDSLPTLIAPGRPLLREYLGARNADQVPWPLKENVELGISCWLRDLANGMRKPDPTSDADQMIVKSGLYELIKGGVVQTDVPT